MSRIQTLTDMNQYSKEIHDDLEKFANKYGINKGMILFQEKDIKDPSVINSRVIVFSPELKVKFEPRDYAKMFLSCLNVSKTLQKIMEKVNEISMTELVRHIHTEHELQHPEGRVKN